MQREGYFLIGKIFKLHGYKGEVNIYNNNESQINLNNISHLFIELENMLIPFSLNKIREIKKNIILAKFEEVDNEERAKRILNKKVYIPLDSIKYFEENKSNDIVQGLSVIDTTLGFIGIISHIDSQTPQQLIYVENKGKTFCFPMNKRFLLEVNTKEGLIKVDIPQELINLN